MNQYETLLWLLGLWMFLAAVAAAADAVAGATRARHAYHRARHSKAAGRHMAARPDPYRNDYQIRRPSRFPAPPKGWDAR